MDERSIVQYLGLQEDKNCGYCKSTTKDACSHGILYYDFLLH